MSVLYSIQQRLGFAGRAKTLSIVAPRRPAIWRRVMAGVIDRCAPLPFLAFFFPRWTLVVLVYHLLCDCTPERRSLGKWLLRLRVVSAGKRCHPVQAMLRRVGMALTQTAWALWQWIPFVLAYELIALACVLLDVRGRRPEDFVAGTRVVTEKEYRRAFLSLKATNSIASGNARRKFSRMEKTFQAVAEEKTKCINESVRSINFARWTVCCAPGKAWSPIGAARV